MAAVVIRKRSKMAHWLLAELYVTFSTEKKGLRGVLNVTVTNGFEINK